MKTTVFIAWRGGGPERGEWSPIGRLEHLDGEYRFVYTQGALTLSGFHPFPAMPDLHTEYSSRRLFPVFSNRLLSSSRTEYERWLAWSGFDSENPPAPLAILGVTEGIRQTDALEMFPKPVPDNANNYHTRFFLHGMRHAPLQALERVKDFKSGKPLRLVFEDSNRYDQYAVAVFDNGVDSVRLGYVPRYLARDVRQLDRASIDLRVAKVNWYAPLQMRLLCTLKAPWPKSGFQPCTGPEFQSIAREACQKDPVLAV